LDDVVRGPSGAHPTAREYASVVRCVSRPREAPVVNVVPRVVQPRGSRRFYHVVPNV